MVAPQALMLLNDEFVHAESKALAKKASSEGDSIDSILQSAWRIALGRNPRPGELAQGRSLLEKLGKDEGLRSLCHVLLNTNEFAHVD